MKGAHELQTKDIGAGGALERVRQELIFFFVLETSEKVRLEKNNRTWCLSDTNRFTSQLALYVPRKCHRKHEYHRRYRIVANPRTPPLQRYPADMENMTSTLFSSQETQGIPSAAITGLRSMPPYAHSNALMPNDDAVANSFPTPTPLD